ncbi:hypothetical protein [Lysobacter sp. N42]|uniref:hypothetical protein n=1 Tax=Lysobacter sp. N42 TaxID=2545719 RepID=UPI001045C2A0|nr:hypothetical protein [Lysobacter sp. N42]TCZ82879.1 hypothetical protein EYQ95_22215 [Lysobacter sp. N42]
MGTFRQGAPAELWQALVHDAGERAGCALDESRESYLVFVLLRHQRDGQLLGRTQALDWLHAQSLAGSPREEALRDVGDRCLLIAGLYPALAERRRVTVDYFTELGRGAYLSIAEAGRSAYAALFSQLAASYADLVCILRAVRVDARLLPVMPMDPRRH